ncbi:MAG: hypothetical protein ACLGJD_01855 [Gammaproteobacteria bacterium]|uniref:hypothetical protein n=1 Tax=unclassified Pseudacidovorax TaxID=2620592 RepID=UPI001B708EA9|nr:MULTISPECIES: hypothetical protein [unclassified Pseudacidovorax]MBP6894759.1 hypothetical protein [Pseudacidovorax sp.]
MPLSLLHRLASAQLPVSFTEGGDIDAIRMLALAGHVQAVIPRPVRTLSGHHQPAATVSAITPLGRQMMERFPREAEVG